MPDDGGRIVTRADVLNSIGADYYGKGNVDGARLHYLAALHVDPNHSDALLNLGAALRSMGHFEASVSVARRSVRLSNGNIYAKMNLGVALLALRRYDEALDIMGEVVDELGEAGPAQHNYGLVLYILNWHEEALRIFDRSIELDPHNTQCQSDRALTLLALGRLQEGLAAYEVRWLRLYQNEIWKLGVPEWKGEDLAGQHILLNHEQGFGDSIMLSRFVRDVAAKAGAVTLAVPAELIRLFANSFPDVRVVDVKDELQATAYDFHSPLLSTMRWLGVAEPSAIDAKPYLHAARVINTIRLPSAKFKIGVCWASGNHGSEFMERRRVVPVTSFLPLTELPDVALVSLQKGDPGNDIQRHGMEGLIYDATVSIDDFADTADVINHLDLVVSVDSAVAHLTGAIGKPCMMLAPYTRCWRWWNNNGLPWYNNMTQYTQAMNGTWDDAMRAVLRDVGDMASAI